MEPDPFRLPFDLDVEEFLVLIQFGTTMRQPHLEVAVLGRRFWGHAVQARRSGLCLLNHSAVATSLPGSAAEDLRPIGSRRAAVGHADAHRL